MQRAHAVVIGAGIAGLTAAKTLADRFERVTVLDRDMLPDDTAPRRGVPQGAHGHILLSAGERALNELFPGFADELAAAGAVPFEPGLDMCLHRFGGVWPRVDTGLGLISFSRPLLELTLRKRLSNVEIRGDVAVSGLTGSSSGVTGVSISGEHLGADLVVDCTGRGSRSDRWLSALDFPTPGTAEVKIGVGYATRVYQREPGFLPDGKAAFVVPTAPEEKRAGLVLPIEGDRWLVSQGGWHGDYPRGEEEFVKFARELPHPAVADLIESATPLSELHSFGFPASRRRYFEKLARYPSGYLATGDAICSFNPIYGQGMTCAALEALTLGTWLDQGSDPRAFYRAAAKIIAVPWRFAAGGDFAYPETTGPKPRGIGLLNGYSRRVQIASRFDPEVRRLFTAVQHLVTPPGKLFAPSTVVRVLRASRGHA